MKKHWKLIVILAFFLFFNTVTAFAYNQNPNLNWGYTNIMDAMIPPPGIYMSNYLVWYHSDEFKDANGTKLPLENELDVLAYVPQFFWIPNIKLPNNFKFGIQANMPFVDFDLDSDIGLTASNRNMGDLCVGPFIGSVLPLSQNVLLHWFFEFDVYFPVGEYDKEYNLNPGANFWTFEPFVSITLQMPHGFTFSTRQHLTFNTTNDEFPGMDGKSHDLEPGMLYHANFSLMKTVDFISPDLRFGAVGYYCTQIEEDLFDDKDWDEVFGASSKEKIFAVGPAVSYFYKGIFFSLKSYFESGAENRPQGEKIVFRLLFPFK